MAKKKEYLVSCMTQDEMSFAIAWAKKEGWNPGLHDEECFYQTDPGDFLLANPIVLLYQKIDPQSPPIKDSKKSTE